MSFRQLLHHFSAKLSDIQPFVPFMIEHCCIVVASKFASELRCILLLMLASPVMWDSIEVKCYDVPRIRSNFCCLLPWLDTTSSNFRPIRTPSLTKGLQTYTGSYKCVWWEKVAPFHDDDNDDQVNSLFRGWSESCLCPLCGHRPEGNNWQHQVLPNTHSFHFALTHDKRCWEKNKKQKSYWQDFGWNEVQVAQGGQEGVVCHHWRNCIDNHQQ